MDEQVITQEEYKTFWQRHKAGIVTVIFFAILAGFALYRSYGAPLMVFRITSGILPESAFQNIGYRSLALSLGTDSLGSDFPKLTLDEEDLKMRVYINDEEVPDYSEYHVRSGDELKINVSVKGFNNKVYIIPPVGVMINNRDLSGSCQIYRDWYYICSGLGDYSVTGTVVGNVGVTKSMALYVKQQIAGEWKTDLIRRKVKIFESGQYTDNELVERLINDLALARDYTPPTQSQMITFLDAYDAAFDEPDYKSPGEFFENHFKVSEIARKVDGGLLPLSPKEWETFKKKRGYWQSYRSYLEANKLNVIEWVEYFNLRTQSFNVEVPAGEGSAYGQGKQMPESAHRTPAGMYPGIPVLEGGGQTGSSSGGGTTNSGGNDNPIVTRVDDEPKGPLCPEEFEKAKQKLKEQTGISSNLTYDQYLEMNGYLPSFWRKVCEERKKGNNDPQITMRTDPEVTEPEQPRTPEPEDEQSSGSEAKLTRSQTDSYASEVRRGRQEYPTRLTDYRIEIRRIQIESN